ncbi:endonuclease/exonuclease/phosphatase family protein [Agarivorans sp. QJM3NY_29]|uniref:endonuclease/exonuclease/phosphatase family protein n=1 Tax=unclassified Agarivorans TaxID=2636026 RepID=UPI003D7E6A15
MSLLLKYFSITLSLFSLLLATLIMTLGYWPETTFSISLSYLLLFSPRWWLIILSLLPLFVLKQLSKWQYLSWALCAVVFFQFQDIQLHWPSERRGEMSILTLNSGGGANAAEIHNLVEQYQPDVVFMQESNLALLEKVFDARWYRHCDSLCTASRTPLEHQGSISRSTFGGWGNFAVFYQTTINDQVVHLANIHLETPRSTITSLLHRNVDKNAFADLHFARNMETSLVGSWAKQHRDFIIAGDFNMTVQEKLYQKYLSTYQNAIDTAGSGINYSKYTTWHGTRIDHILASDEFSIQSAKALAAVGGDHHPILASFTYRP